MKRARILDLLGLKDSDALQAAALDLARLVRNGLPDVTGYVEEVAEEHGVPEAKCRQGFRDLMALLFAIADEQACRVCGCTQNDACEGGCSWVETDLCSSCVCGARAKWGSRELVCVKEPHKTGEHESAGRHNW